MQARRRLFSSETTPSIPAHPSAATAAGMRSANPRHPASEREPSISLVQSDAHARFSLQGGALDELMAPRSQPAASSFSVLPEPVLMQVTDYLGPADSSALSRVERHCHARLGPAVFRQGLAVRSDRASTLSNFHAVMRDSRRLQPEHRSAQLTRLGRSLLRMHRFVMGYATGPLLQEVKQLPEAVRSAPLGTAAVAILCRDGSALESRAAELRELEAAFMDLPVPLRVDALTALLGDIRLQPLTDPLSGRWVAKLVTTVARIEHVWQLRDASRPDVGPKSALSNVERALRLAIAELPANTPEALLVALAMPRGSLTAQQAKGLFRCLVDFAAQHPGSTAALAYIALAELLPVLPASHRSVNWLGTLQKLGKLPAQLHCWILESLAYGMPKDTPELHQVYWRFLFGPVMMLPSSEERYVVLRQLCHVQPALAVVQNGDIRESLVALCAKQEQPYRATLLHLALVRGEPAQGPWCEAAALMDLSPDERPRVLQALALTLDRAPQREVAWREIFESALQLPPGEQGAVLAGLARTMHRLPQASRQSALTRLLGHARKLPRKDRMAILELLAGALQDSALSLQVFQAVRELPRLDRALPLSGLAASLEQLPSDGQWSAAWKRILHETLELRPSDRLSPLIELDRTKMRLPMLTRWLAELKQDRQLQRLPTVDAACLDAFRHLAMPPKSSSTQVRLP